MRKLRLYKILLSFCLMILLLGGEFVGPVMANNEQQRVLQDAYENEQRILLVAFKIRNITEEYDVLLEKALNDASISEKIYSKEYRQLGYEGSSESYKDMLAKYAEVQKIIVMRQDLVSSEMEKVGTEDSVKVRRLLGAGEATLVGCAAGGVVGCAAGAVIEILGMAIVFGMAIYAKNAYERQVEKENKMLYCAELKAKRNQDCDSKGNPIPLPIPPKVPDLKQCEDIILNNNGQQNGSPWNSDGKTKECQCVNDPQGNRVEICEFK